MRLVCTFAFLVVTVTVAHAQNVCTGVSEVSNSDLTRVTIASGLISGPSGPVFVTAPPGDTGRIFIVLQDGIVRQLARGAAPTASTAFLDISARVTWASPEQGVLGFAFDPAFATNGFFYVDYTRASDGGVIVSKFKTLDGTPNTVGDPSSEKVLFRIDHPEPNHNGGWIGFGPDGFLYVAVGDGGGGGDNHGTCGNAQNKQVLLGKILRIDPRGGPGTAPDCGADAGLYVIPPGNPFADGSGTGNCDEIWAYGLRNPWRDSFDRATGDLYIGDVGEGCWEEINWQPASSTGGENYGWRLFEGKHCYDGVSCNPTASPAGCSPVCSDPAPTGDAIPNGTRAPIMELNSNVGSACAVTGGYVYRGCRMSNFRGTYFYGDWCAGTVASFDESGGVATNPRDWTAQLGSGLGFALTSFGTDAQGEIYIADSAGFVHAILPPFPDFEVAGTGSGAPLRLQKSGDWTWENLQTASWQPVSAYRVYRAMLTDGKFDPGEIFNCVHTGPTPSWPGGDPVNPALGDMFAYVVTATNPGGQQTSPGGTPVRTLGTASCP